MQQEGTQLHPDRVLKTKAAPHGERRANRIRQEKDQMGTTAYLPQLPLLPIKIHLLHVSSSFCLITIYITLWSNLLNNRINFSLKHKLSPCHQQKLLQVYWKMFTYTKNGIAVENFVLYYILCVIQFVLFL